MWSLKTESFFHCPIDGYRNSTNKVIWYNVIVPHDELLRASFHGKLFTEHKAAVEVYMTANREEMKRKQIYLPLVFNEKFRYLTYIAMIREV